MAATTFTLAAAVTVLALATLAKADQYSGYVRSSLPFPGVCAHGMALIPASTGILGDPFPGDRLGPGPVAPR